MDKPAYIKPKLISAPKIRGIYWCNFWKDVMLPEMWKKRPVLVVSFKNLLNGPCSVLAISTDEQVGTSAQWAHKLAVNIEVGRQSWVACNHIYTVSPSRLEQVRGGVLRLQEDEFNAILAKLFAWLPTLPKADDSATD